VKAVFWPAELEAVTLIPDRGCPAAVSMPWTRASRKEWSWPV